MKVNDQKLFNLIQALSMLPYDLGATPHTGVLDTPWLNSRWDEGVNGCWNQTSQGVFFEVYYGIPGSLWTPWGKWNCWGGGSGRHTYLDKMLVLMGAEEYLPLEETDMGMIGPVYKVTQVPLILHNLGIGHQPIKTFILLPDAILKPRDEYTSYEEVHIAWYSMVSDEMIPRMSDFNRKETLRWKTKAAQSGAPVHEKQE